MTNGTTKMQISFLGANQAWCVTYGEQIIEMRDPSFQRNEKRLFDTIEELLEGIRLAGLSVRDNGELYLSDEARKTADGRREAMESFNREYLTERGTK